MPDPLAELLREAYATGWAASGGPMTDRVRAACAAAVDAGLAHPDEPGLVEATLQLGHLEGVWARIFDRRLKLHADNDADLLALWRPIAAALDVDTLVRHVLRPSESIDLPAKRLADIASRVASMLKQVVHNTSWKTLRKAVRDALARARAEGKVDALALAADSLGEIGFDFGLAFDTAYAALDDVADLLTDADAWLADAIGDQGAVLGKKLASLISDEASADDITAAVTALLADGAPVALVIDQLTGRAMVQGALDLYATEGVATASVITAGDDRVCPQCDEYEANSPYALADFPTIPAHPLCRCAPVANDPLPLSAFQPYLTDDGE